MAILSNPLAAVVARCNQIDIEVYYAIGDGGVSEDGCRNLNVEKHELRGLWAPIGDKDINYSAGGATFTDLNRLRFRIVSDGDIEMIRYKPTGASEFVFASIQSYKNYRGLTHVVCSNHNIPSEREAIILSQEDREEIRVVDYKLQKLGATA